jgi:hypothetical protein
VVKFLIDECLSLDLVGVACDRGFVESSHVTAARVNSLSVGREASALQAEANI